MTWYDKNNKQKKLKETLKQKELEFYKYYYDNYFKEIEVKKDKEYHSKLKELKKLKDEYLILDISSVIKVGNFDEEK